MITYVRRGSGSVSVYGVLVFDTHVYFKENLSGLLEIYIGSSKFNELCLPNS